jgi:hypothetical protein
LVGTQSGGKVVQLKLKPNTLQDSSNSSSTSSLVDLVNLNPTVSARKQTKITAAYQQTTSTPSLTVQNVESEKTIEDLLTLLPIMQISDAANSYLTPTYLLANVRCQEFGQCAYCLTFAGDVFFLDLSNMQNETKTEKRVIWHRPLLLNVLSYTKVDIDVSFFILFF